MPDETEERNLTALSGIDRCLSVGGKVERQLAQSIHETESGTETTTRTSDGNTQRCRFSLKGGCGTGNGIAGLALEWVVVLWVFLIFQNSHRPLGVSRIKTFKVSQSSMLHPASLLSCGPAS